MARPNFGPIARTKKVRVQPTQGPAYEFMYAPLEAIIDASAAPLAEQGLAMMQPCYAVPGGHEIRTILAHASGSYLESIMFVSSTVHYFSKQDNAWVDRPLKIQELGSEITYKRRYSLQCVLGVNAEDDDDGNAADGNEVQSQAKTTPRSQPTPPAPKAAPVREQKPKAPPVDPQIQADIERRRNVTQADPDALRTVRLETGPGGVARVAPALDTTGERVGEARAVLAEAEASQGVAPAVVVEKTPSQYPGAPGAGELPDSHVADAVTLPQGAATREAMRKALADAGKGGPSSVEFVLRVTGVDPTKEVLNYGHARAVIAALGAP